MYTLAVIWFGHVRLNQEIGLDGAVHQASRSTVAEASQAFLQTASYAAYLADVEPLLSGPPQVMAMTPVLVKNP